MTVEMVIFSLIHSLQVNLYSGALFIQQALQWNLYLSIFALLALTCICTIGKYFIQMEYFLNCSNRED